MRCPPTHTCVCHLLTCPENLPAVPGDALRREPVCYLAIEETSHLYGPKRREFRNIEWVLGIPEDTAHVAARDGMKKMWKNPRVLEMVR